MTDDELDEPETRDPIRKDEGYSTSIELRERLTRLEEKQDAQIEKLDYISDQIDERLATVSEKVETMLPRHNRMWFVYRGSKWLLGGLIAGGVTIEITGWL